MDSLTKVFCPSCGREIDVAAAMTKHFDELNRAKLEKERNDLVKSYEKRLAEEAKEKKALEQSLEQRLAEELKERDAREASLRQTWIEKVKREAEEQTFQETQKKIGQLMDERSKAVNQTRQLEAALEQAQSDAAVAKQNADRDLKVKEDQLRQRLSLEIREQDNERFDQLMAEKAKDELKIREERLKADKLKQELDHKLQMQEQQFQQQLEQQRIKSETDHKVELERIRQEGERMRKLGTVSISQEMQGEKAEMQVLTYLRQTFPHDRIEEVAKGARGADVIHYVLANDRRELGSILYEVKDAKTYASEWTSKLRQNMVDANADLGVLVTQALPSEMAKASQEVMLQNGSLCVVQFERLPVIAQALRQLVVVASTRLSADQVQTRKDLLWQSVNKPQFKQAIHLIDERFKEMKEELEAHHSANLRYYKKQLKKNAELIEGIATVQVNVLLEGPLPALPDSAEEDEEDDGK